MSLSSMLKKSITNSVDNADPNWVQFIYDHLTYITQRSKRYTVTPELIHLYQYDLKRFLRDYEGLSRSVDMAWIVLCLNNMSNDLEFFRPGKYVIPPDALIQKLYASYLAINYIAK